LPTLLNKNGFKFFFYANEHEPKHIHIRNSSGFAKVELDNLKLALKIVKENREDLSATPLPLNLHFYQNINIYSLHL
jgi:hypothetical protein